MVETSLRPAVAVGASLAAAMLIFASGRRPNLREFWTFLAGGIKLACIASLVPGVLAGKVYECVLMRIAPGVELALRVDAMGLYFALLASFLWILTSVYSIGYMRSLKEHAQTRYYASFAICLSSAIGVALARNLLTFYIFYEVLSVATYPLVAHHEDAEARRSGREYLAYLLSAGAVLLVAVVSAYVLAGHGEFTPGGFLAGTASDGRLRVLFWLFLFGCGVKAAVMPMHAWLPSAMVAPTPVSALLHAVAVVKAGVFGCLRIMGFVYGPKLMAELGVNTPLAVLAGFTVVAASMIALRQDPLKKRLAYSTIGQLSYIILGAALLGEKAWTGALLHLSNHAFMKITLFFCAGAIYVGSGRTKVSELAGLGRRMPLTFAAFTIASLGFAGLPGLAGFISKFYLCVGSVQVGLLWPVGVLLVSAVLNAAYFLPIVYSAFFLAGDTAGAREAPKTMTVPLLVSAALTIAFGSLPFLFAPQWSLAASAARAVTGGGP